MVARASSSSSPSSAAAGTDAGKTNAGEGEGGGERDTAAVGVVPGCSMDELVGLCKRRGFVFPSSEVGVCVFSLCATTLRGLRARGEGQGVCIFFTRSIEVRVLSPVLGGRKV